MFIPKGPLFAVSLCASLVLAGNLDNSDVEDTVNDAMVHLPNGKYTFQNVATGEYLVYNHDHGQALFPKKGFASFQIQLEAY